MSRIQSIGTIICGLAFSTAVLAEPAGFITFSIDRDENDFEVCEISVTGGVARVLDSTDIDPFHGIDAPPFLGDRCVMGRAKPDVPEVGIALINREGTTYPVIVSEYPDGAKDPGISFDGRYIAYVIPNAGASGEDELHIVLPNGQDDTTVYTTAEGVNSNIERPRFHPDGLSLMFWMRNVDAATEGVYTMPVTGGVPQKITTLPYSSQQAVYSPDGRHIAYVEYTDKWTLSIANADGSDPQAVNLFGKSANYPCFSPDSRYVVVRCNEDVFNIIDISDKTIARTITVTNDRCYGVCWHLGASRSDGAIDKTKINRKKVSIKLRGFVPDALPGTGLMQVDRTVIPLDNATLWQNKKDKKYLYKDKTNKRKGKIVLKNGKATFSAKKLSLTEGNDFRLLTNVPVAVNAGDVSIVSTIPLDKKGKYKAPKE